MRRKYYIVFFFFQAEDGIRDVAVTGVQTCALPISARQHQEQSQLLRRMGLARGAHSVRARTIYLSEPANGDRPLAVYHAGFQAHLERRAGRPRRDTDRYRLDAILAWRRRRPDLFQYQLLSERLPAGVAG